ncbi:hypothetical protein TRVA0_040S01354 [Trichomonascus vanleenenianus]|uniref:uncharacterized protein n=1 Tax=Trichomonascus vanleenenianus TaxID=2268995 RepID=UPI003EC9D40E
MSSSEVEEVELEPVEADEVEQPPPLSRAEWNNLRMDAKQVLRSLDQEQHLDLAKHLYSAHLLHRKPENQGKTRFPTVRWTAWPMSATAPSRQTVGSSQYHRMVMDHRAPVPKAQITYTDPGRPAQYPLADQTTPAISAGLFTDPVRGGRKDPFDADDIYPGDIEDEGEEATEQEATDARATLLRATDDLIFELNASFQRTVHNRIHKAHIHGDRIIPIVAPEPTLPVQSRERVFAVINQILDVQAEKKCRRLKDWKDVVEDHALSGHTISRCRRLFLEHEDVGIRKKKQKKKHRNMRDLDIDELRTLNLMTDKSGLLGTPTPTSTARPSDADLLADMTISFQDDLPELEKQRKMIKKAQASSQRRSMAQLKLKSVPPLKLIDRQIYKKAQKNPAWTKQYAISQDAFVVDPRSVSQQRRLAAERLLLFSNSLSTNSTPP